MWQQHNTYFSAILMCTEGIWIYLLTNQHYEEQIKINDLTDKTKCPHSINLKITERKENYVLLTVNDILSSQSNLLTLDVI